MEHDQHDPFCFVTFFGDKPGQLCVCEVLNMARVEERERIARAIVAERDSRPVMDTDSPWRALTVAARIARGGGDG